MSFPTLFRWRSKYSIRECGGLEPYGLIGKVLGGFVNLKSITERMQAVWKQAGMKGGVQIKAMGGADFLFRFANVEYLNVVITIV